MSGGAIFILFVGAMFPTVIIVAVVVKLWEVRQAKRWPSTEGKVISSGITSRKNKPGEIGYNFSDTEVSNDPLVKYEYTVANRKCQCNRITIGEKTSASELEEILARYPVGTPVTVYYDPTNPEKAVLERDLPWGILFWGVGCLLLFFIGGPLIAAAIYFNAVDWLKSHMANPKRAPFVAAAGGFGLLVFLFALGFTRAVRQAARWPVTRGRIIASGTDTFRDYDTDAGRRRIRHKPSVVYEYEVNGRQYKGDRVTFGVVTSSSHSGVSQRLAARYPVGTEVDVHYNPKAPGESVLRPHSVLHYLLWVVAAAMFALAWAVATGRLG